VNSGDSDQFEISERFFIEVPHSGREDARGTARNGASRKESLIVSCYN
jgi:hypothetical protein